MPLIRLLARLFILLMLPGIPGAQAGWLPHASAITAAALPPEAAQTLANIHAGGPFPFRRDGVRFQNREARLPDAPSGYYREYTVISPGSRDRGARRIISGGQPPEVFYYTDDHYRSFLRIKE